MSNTTYSLESTSPLSDFKKDFGSVKLEEVTGKALVSIAEPQGNKTKLNAALKKTLGAEWPKIGNSENSGKGYKLLGIQRDMAFALFEHPGGLADASIKKGLKDTAYCTDQSDAWVMLRISGEGVYSALERICPLNISAGAFSVGAVARTQMEHLGVVIFKEDEGSFVLMSATSSADDLLHAVVVSIEATA